MERGNLSERRRASSGAVRTGRLCWWRTTPPWATSWARTWRPALPRPPGGDAGAGPGALAGGGAGGAAPGRQPAGRVGWDVLRSSRPLVAVCPRSCSRRCRWPVPAGGVPPGVLPAQAVPAGGPAGHGGAPTRAPAVAPRTVRGGGRWASSLAPHLAPSCTRWWHRVAGVADRAPGAGRRGPGGSTSTRHRRGLVRAGGRPQQRSHPRHRGGAGLRLLEAIEDVAAERRGARGVRRNGAGSSSATLIGTGMRRDGQRPPDGIGRWQTWCTWPWRSDSSWPCSATRSPARSSDGPPGPQTDKSALEAQP